MSDKWAIIQEIIKHKGWSAIFSAMATGLRDETETMQGRRQGWRWTIATDEWIPSLPSEDQKQEYRTGNGGQRQRLGAVHVCTNSSNSIFKAQIVS